MTQQLELTSQPTATRETSMALAALFADYSDRYSRFHRLSRQRLLHRPR